MMENPETPRECSYPAPVVPEVTEIQKRLQKLCEGASENAQTLPEIVVPPDAKSKKKKKKKKKKNVMEDESEEYVDYSESNPVVQAIVSGAMGFPPVNILESGAMGFPPRQMESVPLESTPQEGPQETYMEIPPEDGGLPYPGEEGDFSQHRGGIRGHGGGPFRGSWRGTRGYRQGGGPPFHAPPGPGGAFTPPSSQYSGTEGAYYQGYQAQYDPSHNYSQFYGQGGPPSQYGGPPMNPQGPGFMPTDPSGWDQSAWGHQNQQVPIPYPPPMAPNQQNPLLPPVPVEAQAVTMAHQPEQQLVMGASQPLPNIPLPPPPSEPPSSIPLPQPLPPSQPLASDIPLPPSDIPMPPSKPADRPSNQITKGKVDLNKDISVLRREALADMDVPALSPAEPEEVRNVSECVMPSGEKALVVDTTPIVGLSPTAELMETETKEICDSKLPHHTVSDFKPGTSESGSSENKGDTSVFKDDVIESKDTEDSEKKDDNQSKPVVKTTAQMLLEKIAMKKKATEVTESGDMTEVVADVPKRKTLKPGSKFLLQQLKQDAGKVQFNVKHGAAGPKKGNALQKSEKTEAEDISKFKGGARELYKPSDQDKVDLLLETMTPKQRDSYLRYQEQKEREARREERRRQRELERQRQEEKGKDTRTKRTESIEKEMDIPDTQRVSSPHTDHVGEQIVDKKDDGKSEERTKQLDSESSVEVKEKDSRVPSTRFDSDRKADSISTQPLALSGMDNHDKQTIIAQSSMLHQTQHSTRVLSPKLNTENGHSSQTVPSIVHRVEGITIDKSSEGTQSDKSDKKKKSRWSEPEVDISSSPAVSSSVIGGVPAAVPMPTNMEVYSPDHPTGSPQIVTVTGDSQKYSPNKPTGMEYSPSHPTEDYSPSRPTDTPSPHQAAQENPSQPAQESHSQPAQENPSQPAQESQPIEAKDSITTSDTQTIDQPASVSGEQLNKESENIGTSNTKAKKKKSKKKSKSGDRSLSRSPKGKTKEKMKGKSKKVFPQVKGSFSWDSDEDMEQPVSDTKHYSRSRSRSPDSVDNKQKEKSHKRGKRLKSPKHKKHSRSRSRSVDSRSHKRSLTPKKRRSRSLTPRKRKSCSPLLRKRKSRSPTPRKRKSRSPSPRKRKSRSPSPRKRKSRSPTPRKRKSRSPTPRKQKSRSPTPRKRKSRSPTPRKRKSRSPSPRKQRSRSLTPRKHRSRSKSQSRSLDTKDTDRKSGVKSKDRFSLKHKSRSRTKSPSEDRNPRKDKSVIKTSKNRSRSRSKNRSRSRSADSNEVGGKRKMSKNRHSFRRSKSRSRTRSRSPDSGKDKSSRRSASPKHKKMSTLSRSRSRSWEKMDGKKRKSKKKRVISRSSSRSRSRSVDVSRKRKDERDRSRSISPKQNKSDRRKKKQSHSSDRSRSSSPVHTKTKRNRTASNKQSESPFSTRRGRRESPRQMEDNTVSPYRRRRNSSSPDHSKVSSTSKKTSHRKSSLSPYQSDEDKRRKSPKRKSKKSKGKSPSRDIIPKELSKDSKSVSPKRGQEREPHEGSEQEKSPEVNKETRAPISFKMNISRPLKPELPSLGNKLDDSIEGDADGDHNEGGTTDLGENLRQRDTSFERKSETLSKLSESSILSCASTHSPVRSPAQDVVSLSKCVDSEEERKLSKKAKKAAKKSRKRAKKAKQAKEKSVESSNSSLNISAENMDVDQNSPDKALDRAKVEDQSEGVKKDLSTTNDASDKVSSPESRRVKRRSWRSKTSNSDEDSQKASPEQSSAGKLEKDLSTTNDASGKVSSPESRRVKRRSWRSKTSNSDEESQKASPEQSSTGKLEKGSVDVGAIPLPGQESSTIPVKESSISMSNALDKKTEKVDSPVTYARDKKAEKVDSSVTNARDKKAEKVDSPVTNARDKKAEKMDSPVTNARDKKAEKVDSPVTNARDKKAEKVDSSVTNARDKKAEKVDSPVTDLSLIPMPGEIAAIGKEFKTAANDMSIIPIPESQSAGKEDVEKNPEQNENAKPSVTKSENSDTEKYTEDLDISQPEETLNPVDVSNVTELKDSKHLVKSNITSEEKIKRELRKLNIDMVKSTFDLEGEQPKRRSRRSHNSAEKEEENESIEPSKRTTRRRSKVSVSTEDPSESENSQTETTSFQSCSDTEKPTVEVVQELPDTVKEKPAKRRRKSRFSDIDDKTDKQVSLTPEKKSEPSMMDMSPDPDKLPKVSVTLEPIKIDKGSIRTPIKFALANVTQAIGKVKWDEEEGDSEKETEASFKFVPDEDDPEISFKIKDGGKEAETETEKEGRGVESIPETAAKDDVPLVVTYPGLSMPSVSSSQTSEKTQEEKIIPEKEDIFQIALRKAKALTDGKMLVNVQNKVSSEVPAGEDNIETVDMECDSNSNSQEPFIFEGNGNPPQSSATTQPLTTFPKFTGGFSLESMIPDFGMPLKDRPSTEQKPNPPAPVPPPMDIPPPPFNPPGPVPPPMDIPPPPFNPPAPVPPPLDIPPPPLNPPPHNPPLPPPIHIPPPQPVMPPAFLPSAPLNQPPMMPLPVRAPPEMYAPVSSAPIPMMYPPIGTPLPQSTSFSVPHTDIPLPPPPPDKSALKEDKSFSISPAAKPPNLPFDIPMPPEKTKYVGNPSLLKDIPAPPSKETLAQKEVSLHMSSAESLPCQENIPLPSEMIKRKASELLEPIRIVQYEKQRPHSPKQQSVSPEKEMITVEATIENIDISSLITPSSVQDVESIKLAFTSSVKPQEKESDAAETGAENVDESKDTEKPPSVDMAIPHKTSVELSKQALLAKISAKPKDSNRDKKILIGRISHTPLSEKSTEKSKDESEMSLTMKKPPMIKIGPIMMSKSKDPESAVGESSEDGEIKSESENEIQRRQSTVEHSIPISPLVKAKSREDLIPASSGFGLMPKKVIDPSVWTLENPLPEVTNPVSSASESEDSKLDDKEYNKKVDEFLKKVEKPKTTVERKFDEFLEKVRKPKLDSQSLEEKVDEFLKKTEKKDSRGSSHDEYKSSKHDKDDYERHRDRDRDRKDKDKEYRDYREKERDHREKDRDYRGKDRKVREREYDDRRRDYGERHRDYDERKKRRDRRGSRERSRSRERYRERGRERSRERSRSRSRSRSRDRDRRYYEKRSKRARHDRDERRHRDSSDDEPSPKHKSRHSKSNKEEEKDKKKLTDEWLKFESQLAAKKKMLAETSVSSVPSAASTTLPLQQPAVQPAATEYYQDAYGNYYPVPVNQASNASAYPTYPQYPSVNPSTPYPIPPQQAMMPQPQVYPQETYPPLQQVPPQSSQMYNVPNTPVYNTQGQPGHQEMIYGQEQSLHQQVQPTPPAAPRAAVVYGQVPTQPSILSAISTPATVPPTAMTPSLPQVNTPSYPSQSAALVQNMAGVQPLSQPEVGSVCPMNRLPGTPRFPSQVPSTVVRPRRVSSPPIFSPPVRPKGYISPRAIEESREVSRTTPTPPEEEDRTTGQKEETEAQPQQHVTTSEIEESLQPTRNVNRHLPIKLGFKQAIKDSEFAQHPPPSTSPQIKEGKPEKVKSRWRRYSELESPSRSTASPSLDANSVSSSTSQSEADTGEEKEMPVFDGKKIVENYDAWDPSCELPSIPPTAFTKSEEQKKEKREVRSADTTSQVTEVKQVMEVKQDTEVKPEDEESVPKKPSFEEVEDNIYLCERKKTKKMKDVKRMLCDCSTSKEDRDMGYEACGEDCLNRMLYIECGNRCPCGEYCTNKRFHKKQYADVEPFVTDWKGMGLRTKVALQPGAFVMEYVGEVLDYKQFKSRVKQQAKMGQEHHYFMALNSDEVIDASYKGNVSRYMNHSCDPNCETQKWTVNGVLRVGFFVKRPVEALTELNFDYQFERYGKEAQKCFCGSENCRGFIGGSKTTPLRSTKRQEDRRKRTEFEDNLLDEELEAITELENGLRNKDHVLNICRLMVRAETPDHRITILKCLQDTVEDNCLRLFLDYHGLELLWSWITDSREGPEDVKIMILSLLKKLPITNKNILKDSKILPLICRLAGRDENDDLSTVTNPIILGQRGETRSILSTSAGKDKSQKKRVKFADEASSSDNESHSSTTDTVGEIASGELESDLGQRHKSESLYKQVLKSLGGETEVDQEENAGVAESSPAEVPNKGGEEVEKEDVTEEERVVPEGQEKTVSESEENEVKSEEERKEEEAEMKSDIELQAEELLFLWKDLKELFKIPKKQQVEERKRIEKELGMNPDKDLEILEMIQDKSKQRAAGWDTGIRKRKRPPPPPPPMDDEERKVLLPTPPKISKAEHRKMFEARVKAQDEMAVRERQQQEIFLNQFYSDANNILYFNRTPNHPLYGMPPDQQLQILQSQPIEVQYQMVQGYNSQEVVEQYIDPNTGIPITAEQLQAMYQHQQQSEVMYTEDGQPIQQVWPQQQVQQQYMSADGQLVSVHQMDQHLVYSGVPQQQMMAQSVEVPGSLSQGTPIPGQSVYIQQMDNPGPVIGPYGTQTQLAVVPPVAIATTSSADDDDPPPPPSPPKPKVEKLPPNWKSAKDSEGKTYYYHSVTRQTQWDPPSWDSVGADDAMELESPLYEEIVKGKSKKTTTAAADTSSETAKKMKDQFRSKMSSYIVVCLNPFRKPDCKAGRIISTEDFKHLARKLTHHVMAKELKHCRHVEDLEVNENVKSKAKDYVRKYMGKFGSVYRKTGSPDI